MKWDAEFYDKRHAFVFQYGQELVEWLDPQPGERILDLGCGMGHLTDTIAQSGCDVIGIDASPEMVAQAAHTFPDLSFEVGDAADFNFEQPFDAIFSNATLHWVLDHKAAIACMFDQLKPGGRLVLEMGGAGNIEHILMQLRAELGARGYAAQRDLQLWYFPSLGAYAAALEAAGFQVKIAQHYDRPTSLSSEEHGLENWLQMFATAFFEGLPEEEAVAIRRAVQERARPALFQDGQWYADYKRLRILAVRPRKQQHN